MVLVNVRLSSSSYWRFSNLFNKSFNLVVSSWFRWSNRNNSKSIFIHLQRVLWFQSEACNTVKETFPTPKVYIFLISMTRRVDLAMSVCPSVSTQTSLSVLRLSGWYFPKSLLSSAGSISVGTSRIGQLYLIAPMGIIGIRIISLVFFDILSYTIGNFIFCIFNLIIITARVYKLRLAEVNFLFCLTYNLLRLDITFLN